MGLSERCSVFVVGFRQRWIRAPSTRAPARTLVAGAGAGVERRLPCGLELGRRAGRSESEGRGGEAEVLEDPVHDAPSVMSAMSLRLPPLPEGR